MNRRNALAVLAASPLLGLVPKKEAEGYNCIGYDVVPDKVCECFNKTDATCPEYPDAVQGDWTKDRDAIEKALQYHQEQAMADWAELAERDEEAMWSTPKKPLGLDYWLLPEK